MTRLRILAANCIGWMVLAACTPCCASVVIYETRLGARSAGRVFELRRGNLERRVGSRDPSSNSTVDLGFALRRTFLPKGFPTSCPPEVILRTHLWYLITP